MSRIVRAIERRDSISNPSKWLTLAFGGGTDTATGIRVNEVVALRNLTVMSCVNVIAQTVAQLPLLVYSKTSDGGRVRMDSHPLYRILDRQPNDRMVAFTLREVLQAHLLTWGNAYAWRTNAAGVIAGRSWFWQQDMVQADRPASSWPQSMWFSGRAGAF